MTFARPYARGRRACVAVALRRGVGACGVAWLLAICPGLAWALESPITPVPGVAPATSVPTVVPAYSLDRSDEDWSARRGSAQRGPWERLKYLPLGHGGAYVTLASDLRSLYEFYDGYNWGDGPQDKDGYALLRAMGSADLHVGDARLFAELRSGLVSGRSGGARPSQDRDTLDVSQLFAGWHTSSDTGQPWLELRVGRQELNYGEGSLLAIRELNVRRTFDGIKARLRARAWSADLLAFRPALIRAGRFDDGFDASQALWGVWATRPIQGRSFWTRADVFYLGLWRRRGPFHQGTAAERRHTLGVNLHGRRGAWSVFIEADVQFGRFGTGRLRAWKYVQRVSRSFASRRLRPVVTLQGGVSSGDRDPASADLQTFHPLFPRGLYYGRIDGTGSANAIVLHPQVELALSSTVMLEISHFSFWRQSRAEGLYSQPGFPLRRRMEPRGRYVGSLQEATVRWRVDRHATVQGSTGFYEAGTVLRQATPAGRNLFHLSVSLQHKF